MRNIRIKILGGMAAPFLLDYKSGLHRTVRLEDCGAERSKANDLKTNKPAHRSNALMDDGLAPRK